MRITGREICDIVCQHYQIDALAFTSDRRERRISRPRQIAMYLMRRHSPHLSSPEIGRMLGGLDHTTVLYGCRSIAGRIETNPDFAEEVEKIEAKVEALGSSAALRRVA